MAARRVHCRPGATDASQIGSAVLRSSPSAVVLTVNSAARAPWGRPARRSVMMLMHRTAVEARRMWTPFRWSAPTVRRLLRFVNRPAGNCSGKMYSEARRDPVPEGREAPTGSPPRLSVPSDLVPAPGLITASAIRFSIWLELAPGGSGATTTEESSDGTPASRNLHDQQGHVPRGRGPGPGGHAPDLQGAARLHPLRRGGHRRQAL